MDSVSPLSPLRSSAADSRKTFTMASSVNPDLRAKGGPWNQRALRKFDEWDQKLENAFGTNTVQKVLDEIGGQIDLITTPAKDFSRWVDHNGHGKWYTQLTVFLLKLPMRAVRNIVRLVYNIIKGTVYTFVHPLKALNNAGRLLVQLIHALTFPETYTKLGAAIIGGSLGHVAITGGFGLHAYIGLAIGGALLIGGMVTGAALAATSPPGIAKEEIKASDRFLAAAKNTLTQAKAVPEFCLTGFLLAVIVGGIGKAIAGEKVIGSKTTLNKEALREEYLNKIGAPDPTKATLTDSGGVTMSWSGKQLAALQTQNPPLYNQLVPFGHDIKTVTVTIPTPEHFLTNVVATNQWGGTITAHTMLQSPVNVAQTIPITSTATIPGAVTIPIATITATTGGSKP